MSAFCNKYKLKTLNKKSAWFKSYISPSCIELYLTNCPKSFESTLKIETGLSYFHKLIVTAWKLSMKNFPLSVYKTETTKILTW